MQEAGYRALQATSPAISAGRSMAAAGDEGWLRSVAAKEAFLSGQLLQLSYQLLLQVWVHACNIFNKPGHGAMQPQKVTTCISPTARDIRNQTSSLQGHSICLTSAPNVSRAGQAAYAQYRQQAALPGCL